MPAQNIEFKSQQDPSALSQGEGRADLPDPLGEKAHDRVDRYDKKLAEVIGGERPILSGEGKGDKFLEAQLATMSAEGMIPEESNAYYRKPQQERVLGYNPIPHQYVFDREGIYKRLARAGVNDVRVAGDSHQQLRRQRIPMEKQIDSATMTIAIPGDLYAAKEMVHIVREKLSGRMLDHPLIIENAVNAQNEGYWDGLLRGIKIFEKDQGLGVEENKRRKYVDFDALAHHYGIYVTEDRNSTLELAAWMFVFAPFMSWLIRLSGRKRLAEPMKATLQRKCSLHLQPGIVWEMNIIVLNALSIWDLIKNRSSFWRKIRAFILRKKALRMKMSFATSAIRLTPMHLSLV